MCEQIEDHSLREDAGRKKVTFLQPRSSYLIVGLSVCGYFMISGFGERVKKLSLFLCFNG